jgi:hypothetical protein
MSIKVSHRRIKEKNFHEKIFASIQEQLDAASAHWALGSYDEYDMIEYAIDIAESFDGVDADYGYIEEIDINSSFSEYRAPIEIYFKNEEHEKEITFRVYY